MLIPKNLPSITVEVQIFTKSSETRMGWTVNLAVLRDSIPTLKISSGNKLASRLPSDPNQFQWPVKGVDLENWEHGSGLGQALLSLVRTFVLVLRLKFFPREYLSSNFLRSWGRLLALFFTVWKNFISTAENRFGAKIFSCLQTNHFYSIFASRKHLPALQMFDRQTKWP